MVPLLRGVHSAPLVRELQTHRLVGESPVAVGAVQLPHQPLGVRLLAEGGAAAVGGHVFLPSSRVPGRRTAGEF